MIPEEILKQAQEELYTALQAIEEGNLPFARSSSQRASNMITEAWKLARKRLQPPLPEGVQLTNNELQIRNPLPIDDKISNHPNSRINYKI